MFFLLAEEYGTPAQMVATIGIGHGRFCRFGVTVVRLFSLFALSTLSRAVKGCYVCIYMVVACTPVCRGGVHLVHATFGSKD